MSGADRARPGAPRGSGRSRPPAAPLAATRLLERGRHVALLGAGGVELGLQPVDVGPQLVEAVHERSERHPAGVLHQVLALLGLAHRVVLLRWPRRRAPASAVALMAERKSAEVVSQENAARA